MSDEGKLKYEVILDIEDLKKKISESEGKFNEMSKTAKKSGDAIKAAWQAMGGPLLTVVGTATLAGKTFAKVAKDTINSTQRLGDSWQAEVAAWKSAYNSFTRSLASGEGWSNLIKNMTEAYEVGKKVAEILDEIFERQNSLSIVESEYAIEIAKANQTMRDTSKSDEERIAAAQKVIELNSKIAAQRVEIAQQQEDAYKAELQQATKMNDAELEFFVAQYNANRDVIKQSQEYNSEVERLTKSLESWRSLYQTADDEITESMAKEHIDEITESVRRLKNETSDSVKQIADLASRYDLSNDELVRNYVNARAARNSAEAEGISSSTRANTTLASIKEQAKSEAKTRQEAADDLALKQKEAMQKVSEAELKAMVEGHAKKLKEIEAERTATLSAIDKEQEELEKKAQKAGRKVSAQTYEALNARRTAANNAANTQTSEIERENAEYIAGLYRQLTSVFLSENDKRVESIKHTYEEQRKQLERDLEGGTITQSQFTELIEKSKKAEQYEIDEYWSSTYSNYEQKLRRMEEDWQATLASVPAEYAAEAHRLYEQAIADMNYQNLQQTAEYQKFFSANLTLTSERVREIAAQIKNNLNSQLAAGVISVHDYREAWDAVEEKVIEVERQTGKLQSYVQGGVEGLFGRLQNMGNQMQAGGAADYKEAAERLQKALASNDEAAAQLATSSMQAAEATQAGGAAMASAASEAVGVIAIIDAIVHGINDAVHGLRDTAQLIADLADSFGTDTSEGTKWGDTMQFLNTFAEASQYATDGWESLKSGDIMGVVRGIVGSITVWIQRYNEYKDAKLYKAIEQDEKAINKLKESYDDLGAAIDKALGTNKTKLYEDQIENIQRQNQLIREQMRFEEEKKNTDEDAMDEYRRALKENNDLIQDLKDKAVDAIYGEDIQSAITGFVSSVTSAWSEGTKGAKSAKEQVRSMMRQMITEAVNAYVQASGSMERIREAMRSAMADEIVTAEERRRIEDMAEKLADDIENKYGWSKDIFDESERKGLTGSGIAATQDSMDNIDARMTTMQSHTYTLMMGQQELQSVASQILAKVTDIEDHTHRSAESLDALRSGINSMRNTLDDISLRGVKLKD